MSLTPFQLLERATAKSCYRFNFKRVRSGFFSVNFNTMFTYSSYHQIENHTSISVECRYKNGQSSYSVINHKIVKVEKV